MLLIRMSWKTAIATVAALATVGGGAVAARAATTEDDLSQQVRLAVTACKSSATDTNAFAQCLATWFSTNAPAPEPTESTSPEPSETPEVEPSDTPEVEPSDTPEVEPSDTPEVEPSDTPEADDQEDATEPAHTTTVRPIKPVSSEHESEHQSGHDD